MACLLGIGMPESLSRADAPERLVAALTFVERVAYQSAIEEVYWQHRIWPHENAGTKPRLGAVVSHLEIEEEVESYLRKSQLVTDYRGSPIMAKELQAEMDRMACHTKAPRVLRELFAALGEDPLIIAECLVRPILVQRLISELAQAPAVMPTHFDKSLAVSASSSTKAFTRHYRYTLPKISVRQDCATDAWTAATTVNAPNGREERAPVWTGSEMIVWGGFDSGALATGGRYNPATDTWATVSLINGPSRRTAHAAVWTGNEMIIWGGGGGGNGWLNDGGRYNPIADSWTAINTNGAPVGRSLHTAVWTGSEMIVWGGRNGSFWMNSGGRYNPTTDSWTATSIANAPPARWDHTALWTGGEMIVWGGTDQSNPLRTGGRYNPASNSWEPTSLVNAFGRVGHSSVWTGSNMIVWGGVDETNHDANSGGRYNPSNDSWVNTSLSNAPLPRDSHTAVWTGSEMIVWSGHRNPPGANLDSGGKYNPVDDRLGRPRLRRTRF